MTMILSLLTPEFVMQVSDRRLTLPKRAFSQPVTVVDEHANKAVVLDGRIVFGFTGLSCFRGKTSDQWLASLWADYDPNVKNRTLDACAERLTSEFKHIGWSSALKRLAYTGVGWITQPTGLRPAYLAITNFMDREGNWQATANDKFEIRHRYLPAKDSFLLAHSGIAVPSDYWWGLARQIRNMVDRNLSPAIIGGVLITFVRLAAVNNGTVGNKVMLSCIPRRVIEKADVRGSYTMWGMFPSRDESTFCYFDPDLERYCQLGPIFASPGVIMSNFRGSGIGGIGIGNI